MLLNSALTVELEKPNSHRSLGWDKLTNKIISQLSNRGDVIFVLWGNFAQKYERYITGDHHRILKTGHPSPLSANRGYWFGNKHFSQINEILKQWGQKPIHWVL